jgi:hypothetical protein
MRPRGPVHFRPLALAAGLGLLSLGGPAVPARAFSGRIAYTGALGPITASRPLCLCVYTMPDLSNRIGCLLYGRNDVRYDLGNLGNRDYYLIAFVDLRINERRDAQEPFVIFEGRAGTPGDPLNGRSTRADIDFVFGDENLVATATPTGTPDAPPTPPVATATVAAGRAGDCDGDGTISVSELVRGVGIALGTLPLAACPGADRDGNGTVRIEELIATLAAALGA